MAYVAHFGGRQGQALELVEGEDLLAVRLRNRTALDPAAPELANWLSEQALALLANFEVMETYPLAGVAVLHARTRVGTKALRDEARAALKREPMVWFAGRVLVDSIGQAPVLYTENLFIKFADDANRSAIEQVLQRFNLTLRVEASYARNAFFVTPPEGIGLEVFGLAERLLELDVVELCHPELIRRPRNRVAFDPQWHLKRTTINGRQIEAHAYVEEAWLLSQGEGVIVAVIDDGVDIDHEEFRGAGKIVAPRDVSRKVDDPRPGNNDDHGTPCAGVAVANGQFGASGVAPKAKLMPIRLVSGLGSQHEADAFVWAAQHGADVISCSWGPADGRWWDPNDPLHRTVVPLPDSTRLAIDYAVRQGRNGKGCVICFAAGNGNESVDNDGYASYEKVIAVAACNDRGTRAAYSDYGNAIWCAFPSSHGAPSLTPGIWTTDRSGKLGRNPGHPARGDAAGHYTNDFGGTSSAAPGVAGVAALILARNPDLRWDEVRAIIKESCDRIDPEGGRYDAKGHSPYYGYGRVNARRAVELARPAAHSPVVRVERRETVLIPDLGTAELSLEVAERRPIKALRVHVDIEHTYRGDLVVTLIAPDNRAVVLHNRSGGALDDIKQVFDALNAPELAALNGMVPAGRWTLRVEDKARRDVGRICAFGLELYT